MSIHDTTQTASVTMTRQQAQNYMKAMDAARKAAVATIASVKRRRSWSPAVRAMTIADYSLRVDTLAELQRKIGEAFNLGGY